MHVRVGRIRILHVYNYSIVQPYYIGIHALEWPTLLPAPLFFTVAVALILMVLMADIEHSSLLMKELR